MITGVLAFAGRCFGRRMSAWRVTPSGGGDVGLATRWRPAGTGAAWAAAGIAAMVARARSGGEVVKRM